MSGMSSSTGRTMSGIEHIKESIRTILTTPIGTRIERREFGSLLPELIDQPQSDALIMQLRGASVMAIAQFEPRIRMQDIDFEASPTGITLILNMQRLDTGSEKLEQIGVEL